MKKGIPNEQKFSIDRGGPWIEVKIEKQNRAAGLYKLVKRCYSRDKSVELWKFVRYSFGVYPVWLRKVLVK